MNTRQLIATLLLLACAATTGVAHAETMTRPMTPVMKKTAPAPGHALQLRTPNGGENIVIGSRYRIRWMARGLKGTLSIRLLQGRRTIGTIAASVNASAGSYNWRVGSVLHNRLRPGSGYRIRIISSDGRIADLSDRPFALAATTQQARTPQPRQQMHAGEQRTTPGIRTGNRTPTRTTPSTSSKWAPPSGTSTATQQGGQQETGPYITLTSPQQYEGWCTDSPHTITWDTNLPASTQVKIELIQANAAGTLWRTLATSAPNSGSFQWEGINSSDFNSVARGLKVRISTLDNSVSTTGPLFEFGKPLYFDEPNNGMVWRQGAQGRILWKKICTLPGPVNIDLLDSNHQLVQNIRSNLSPIPRNDSNKSELYNWPITTAIEPGAYYLRLSSGPIAMERSITINKAIVFPKSPHFTITSPQQFAGWCTDASHTITWNSDLPATTPVKIELISTNVNGIVVWRTLAASAPNSGSFEWQGVNSADYNSVSRGLRVRISTLDDSAVTVGDIFIFGKPLYFDEPAAPYTWHHGATGTIQWEKVCTQPSPITLDLLDSNHQFVMTIASGLNPVPRLSTNKRELYRWQVPASIAPGAYFIRLSTGNITMEKPINIGN